MLACVSHYVFERGSLDADFTRQANDAGRATATAVPNPASAMSATSAPFRHIRRYPVRVTVQVGVYLVLRSSDRYQHVPAL